MSLLDSELVMQRLFSIAQAVGQNPLTSFTTQSRRFVHFKDVPPEAMPAMYQFQSPIRSTTGGVRGLPRQEIGVSWFVYLPKSTGPDDVVSPALNQYFDALTQALLTTTFDTAGNPKVGGMPAGLRRQDLGIGPGINCYVDGSGLTDEGLLDTPSLIIIPIKILTGM